MLAEGRNSTEILKIMRRTILSAMLGLSTWPLAPLAPAHTNELYFVLNPMSFTTVLHTKLSA